PARGCERRVETSLVPTSGQDPSPHVEARDPPRDLRRKREGVVRSLEALESVVDAFAQRGDAILAGVDLAERQDEHAEDHVRAEARLEVDALLVVEPRPAGEVEAFLAEPHDVLALAVGRRAISPLEPAPRDLLGEEVREREVDRPVARALLPQALERLP